MALDQFQQPGDPFAEDGFGEQYDDFTAETTDNQVDCSEWESAYQEMEARATAAEEAVNEWSDAYNQLQGQQQSTIDQYEQRASDAEQAVYEFQSAMQEQADQYQAQLEEAQAQIEQWAYDYQTLQAQMAESGPPEQQEQFEAFQQQAESQSAADREYYEGVIEDLTNQLAQAQAAQVDTSTAPGGDVWNQLDWRNLEPNPEMQPSWAMQEPNPYEFADWEPRPIQNYGEQDYPVPVNGGYQVPFQAGPGANPAPAGYIQDPNDPTGLYFNPITGAQWDSPRGRDIESAPAAASGNAEFRGDGVYVGGRRFDQPRFDANGYPILDPDLVDLHPELAAFLADQMWHQRDDAYRWAKMQGDSDDAAANRANQLAIAQMRGGGGSAGGVGGARGVTPGGGQDDALRARQIEADIEYRKQELALRQQEIQSRIQQGERSLQLQKEIEMLRIEQQRLDREERSRLTELELAIKRRGTATVGAAGKVRR